MDGKALDRAPIWDDLQTYDGRWLRGGVDVVSAGFPCQPFSTASRGRRTALDLWPDVRRVVHECAAPIVFCENVQREPIERACWDLARAGFRTRFTCVDSAELGAAHRRVRWWLLADLDDAAESIRGLDAEVARLREAAAALWAAGPDRVLGMDDGDADRVDRIRLLGNAVMPAMAGVALQRLLAR
jgi:DNA (cytosine-5)-methyltransferase 1